MRGLPDRVKRWLGKIEGRGRLVAIEHVVRWRPCVCGKGSAAQTMGVADAH